MPADEAPRIEEAEGESRDVSERLACGLPLQPPDADILERIAGRRDELLLEPVLGADEDDPAVAPREVLLRDRDRGVDVPPRAAARDHEEVRHAARPPARLGSRK